MTPEDLKQLEQLNKQLQDARTKLVADYYVVERSVNELLGVVQKIMKATVNKNKFSVGN